MSPLLLLVILVTSLLALIPIARLRHAGWPTGWLAGTWLALTLALVLVIQVPGIARFLVPLIVIAFVAPFVAGPERLTALLRREPRGIVIDVTPRLGGQVDAPAAPAAGADDERDPDDGSETPPGA